MDLLADYKTERGITTIDPGTTLAGGWINFTTGVGGDTQIAPAKVAIGIIVVDENVAAQVPSPFADPHVDWMFYHVGYIVAGERVIVPAERAQIRSQRRMDEIGMNVYAAVETQVNTAYQLDVSLLLRLR